MAKWVARVVGAFCLLVVGVLSGLAGWSQFIASSNPDLALTLYPGDAAAMVARADSMRRSTGSSPQDVAAVGADLARRAPLIETPLLYVGLDQAAKGDNAAARRSFMAVIKRQPRNVTALAWLATDAIQGREYEVAAKYLDRLAILDPKELPLYSGILAAIASSQASLVLEKRLAAGSALAESALERLNATSDDIALLRRLNSGSPQGQARLIARLVEERGAPEAFISWLTFLPRSEALSISWPFDPVFVGNPAPPPFNWQLSEGAELLDQGGLHVSYSGRGQSVFAQQIMMLTPGRYLFQAEMDGETPKSGGILEWQIECYPAQQSLGSVKAQELDPILSKHEFVFVVPGEAGCSAQRLLLQGRPREFPERARATVRRIAIELIGAAE
jgi:hypothetical protein